mmetsp:Transcript_116789/g.376938  ORF Transcript_116789/g.376938 Transcript_116789/m.376938 type:complete len:223 (+) Transcript_116789:1128-1796(+)
MASESRISCGKLFRMVLRHAPVPSFSPLASIGVVDSTTESLGVVRTCTPCIQFATIRSCSFMLSLISNSRVSVERWAMAASFETTFSRSINSLTCSSRSSCSSSSSESSVSTSLRSLVYLKICLQRCLTTESMRSRGCNAMMLMLLLIAMLKAHMMMIMQQMRPIAAAASCFWMSDMSKEVCTIALFTSMIEEFLLGRENVDWKGMESTSRLQWNRLPTSSP